jgi:hypothetical protein
VYGTEIKNTDAARSMAFKASIPDIMKQLGTMKQQYKDEISLFIARLELWIDKNNPNDDHLNIILIHSIKAIKPLLDGLSEDTLTLDKWSACTMKWEEVKKEMKRASDDGI